MHFRVYKNIYFACSGQIILVCFVPFESTMNKIIFKKDIRRSEGSAVAQW